MIWRKMTILDEIRDMDDLSNETELEYPISWSWILPLRPFFHAAPDKLR